MNLYPMLQKRDRDGTPVRVGVIGAGKFSSMFLCQAQFTPGLQIVGIAELSAQALCRMVGKKDKDTTGNSFQYIERYAKDINLSAHNACLKVLKETEKVLNLILKGGQHDT